MSGKRQICHALDFCRLGSFERQNIYFVYFNIPVVKPSLHSVGLNGSFFRMYKLAIFSNLKLIPGKILKKMAFFTESEDPRPLKSEIKMFYSCGLLSIA